MSKAQSMKSAMGKVQQLFGPPQLLEGENPIAYDELLNRVAAAVQPVDIIYAIFIDDVVALEWEVLRWRRFKTILIRMHGLNALTEFLSKHLHYDQYRKQFVDDLVEILQDRVGEDQDAVQLADGCAQNEREAVAKVCQILNGIGRRLEEILKGAQSRRVQELVHEYAQRRPRAIKLVDQLLANANLSIDGLMTVRGRLLDTIERLDRLTKVAEDRRNAMLREIERRRTGLAEALRRNVQEIETEYEVVAKASADSENAA